MKVCDDDYVKPFLTEVRLNHVSYKSVLYCYDYIMWSYYRDQ